MSDAVKSAKRSDVKSPAETPKTDAGIADKTPSAVVKTLREEQPKVLRGSDLKVYGHGYERLTATIPAGWTLDDVLKPGFWTNVVHMFQKNQMTGGADRSGSIIELRTEDGAFYADLIVRAVLGRGLIVQCIGPSQDKTGKACPVDLSTGLPWAGGAALSSDQFDLKWNRDKRGFDIIRKADQQIVADGANFPTRELALEWISKTARAA